MAGAIGFLKKTPDSQGKVSEERDKIQQIKALINTLYKGTVEENAREDGGSGGGRGEGEGKRGDDKEDRDQNSIRLIFSAIKNEFYNFANKNISMNRERVQTNESSSLLSLSEESTTSKSNQESQNGVLENIVLEPLTENDHNPLLTFLNSSLRLDGEGMKVERNFTNRTLDEDVGRNDSLKRNFDFFSSSFFKYNVSDVFASDINGNVSGNLSAFGGYWNNTNLTVDWDPHGNSTWDQYTPMTGK